MMTPGNGKVVAAIGSLFGSSKGSDCVVRFFVEQGPEQAIAKRQRLADGFSSKAVDVEDTFIGDPLPAHKLILSCASERFDAQFERWANASREVQREQPQKGEAPGADDELPELRIPLGSEEEVPSALAAIKFSYTGQIEQDDIRGVLEVRRQAAYLQIDGCAAACDEVLQKQLESSDDVASSSGAGGDAYSDSGEQRGLVLDFYACEALFCDVLEDPSFTAVLNLAKGQLVTHFRDALNTLNTPSLRQQLQKLPAVAVEALLDSGDFGTDSESSVLLMLAAWMQVNHGKTDEATRKRLCRKVRMVQLSRPYLSFVLPALALDYETGKQLPAGWCAVSPLEAAFISHFASSSDEEQKRLLGAAKSSGVYEMDTAVYSTVPRRQCLPEGGLALNWHMPQQELVGLLAIKPGEPCALHTTFEGRLSAISAQGFEWHVDIKQVKGAKDAGLFLLCKIPAAYKAGGSRLGSPKAMLTLTGFESKVTVNRWQGGAKADVIVKPYSNFFLADSGGW
ncbi:hypothetical protein Agub_g366, partial [Astrephomene gubernaculifera]